MMLLQEIFTFLDGFSEFAAGKLLHHAHGEFGGAPTSSHERLQFLKHNNKYYQQSIFVRTQWDLPLRSQSVAGSTCVTLQERFLLYFNLSLAAAGCQGDRAYDVR